MNPNRIRFRLTTTGMFANLIRVVNAFEWADTCDAVIVPKWRAKSCYGNSHRDAWDNYFERRVPACGPYRERTNALNPRFSTEYNVAAVREPIPYEQGESNRAMLEPRDRDLAWHLINLNRLRPKPYLIRKVNESQADLFAGHTVGLHIRGPGGLHGGAGQYCRMLDESFPPYDLYFNLIDRHLRNASRILLCTDAGCVIDRVRQRYGSRVMCPSRCILPLGEPHLIGYDNTYSPEELGEDVVTDAWLLARTDVLIHGCSSVSNFVLCLNPKLPHENVYRGCYEKMCVQG